MRKFLLVFVAIFSILVLKIEVIYAQVDSLHYIPPMCSFTSSSSNVQDHQMVLTTTESTAFNVTIRNNDGTFTRTVSLSSSSPQKISLNWPGRVLNSQGIIGTSQLNNVLDIEGLIVSGSKKFFVNIQQKSGAQGDLLTSKGTTAFGTNFYSGHMYSSVGGYDSQNGHFIGVMATENNTNVTFDNSNILFSGQTSHTFTISLNKGQSVVVGVSVNQIKSQQGSTKDLNVVNGTHITSNKPIAVSSGSWCASGYGNSNPGRDVGFDQLVPTDVVGDEYILIKGEGRSGGAQHNERALVVATEANTVVTYKNNTKTKTLVNAGDYFFTSINDFSNTTDGNIYIHGDKKVFVYQTLSGANKKQTAGLCFIPPLKCTADKEVTVAFANKLSSLGVNPILKLVTQEGSQIKLNGVNLANGFKQSVSGNTYWEAYNIPKTELQKTKYGGGSNWIFDISSTGALNAMLAVESNNVGGGGFFSGFGDIPQIDQNPEIAEQGLCGDNVVLTASGFTNYNWYKDGVLVSANDDATYEPSEPGRYKVTGLSPCGASSTESFPSNEIRILPCLSVNPSDITVTEGTDLNAVFRVELSHIWPISDNVDVTFSYQTVAGTAASGQDFTPKTGSATIPSGSAYVDILVPITNDILNEDDENFTFTISNVVEAIESITVGTATIKDDNDPMPTISVSDQTVNEDAGTITMQVNLNTASGKTITTNYNIVDNTAIQPNDYTASAYSGSLSFAAGETSKNISFNIIDDNIYEPGTNEFFTVQLSSLVNTTAGNINANISIIDNETPPVINIADDSETEGTNIVFQANLSHAADVAITFNYAIVLSNGAGNAKQQDFINYSTFSSGTITIPAGQTTFNFPAFITNDDNANEQTEAFVVNFSSVSNAVLGNTSANGTILDNEGNPTLSISNASATEGNTINFTITVSPVKSSDITFDYRTVNGTANASSDFTGSGWTSITLPANQSSMTLGISTTQDTEEEENESFTVEIGNPPSQVDIGLGQATGTIIDDDDTPDARNDNFTVDEDDVLTNNVMTNDLGLGDPPVLVINNTNPTDGNLVINNDGSFTYTPNANYNGNDSFQYTIEDVDGDQSTATVSITVNPMNDLPIANNDTYSTPEDTALSDDVSSNDQNLFDLPITYSLVSDVSNGSLTLNADGTFTYTPNSEYFGSDGFTYKLTDGNGDAVQASASINVIFNNDAAPVANNDNTSTNEDTAVTIDVLANDTDIDGNQTIDKASVLIKSGPANGSLSQNFVTGEVTYTPNNNFTGADSFTYTIKDNSGAESNTATVSINVTVDNDPPVAICKSGVSIYLDASGSYTLTPAEIDNGSNDDSDGGTVSLSVSPNTFDCSDKGIVTVILTVTDEDLSSTTCTTDITILDNSNPTIKTSQADTTITAEAGICGAVVNYTGPIFTDNCDGDQNGTLIVGLSSGSNFPVGNTTVTYEYTDASGNGPIQSSFTVTVVDDILPVLSNTSNRNVNPNNSGCTYLVSGTGFDVGASDNCGIASITHNYDGGGTSLNGKSFPLGNTDVTWTATDVNGNPNSQIVQISVSTNLGASISGPSGNSTCDGENSVFTASGSGGNPAYSYKFYVNGTEETVGVSGNTFTTNTLADGDKVKTRITDSNGCFVESSEITMTIYPKPNPKLYHE
ncbi:Ig-like domain-containing protein [Labilibaculum sp. DW002]|uniref:Ig-like domain-containing protein n=1 Tax=Paralabilibaculum antarcticum TaxID=2912572 RepID=A0ABT5VVK4_9BACT|nr:Ig-like domain-containing protein [Labilibaculum sp. DW002]MDE5419280.1 Ig-like domain-containing protein [Labilibaculum sp. DW002]